MNQQPIPEEMSQEQVKNLLKFIDASESKPV